MQAPSPAPIVDDTLYQARAGVFQALAHPARVRILEALAERELCVCELQRLVGSSLPTVSRHLAQMRAAGLLGCRREGTNIFYRLLVPCLLPALDCIDGVIRADSERRAACCCEMDGRCEV